jgi:hypothetical protein
LVQASGQAAGEADSQKRDKAHLIYRARVPKIGRAFGHDPAFDRPQARAGTLAEGRRQARATHAAVMALLRLTNGEDGQKAG